MKIYNNVFQILQIFKGQVLLHHIMSGEMLTIEPTDKVMQKLYTKKGQFIKGWLVSDAGKNIFLESTYKKVSKKRVKEEYKILDLKNSFIEQARKDVIEMIKEKEKQKTATGGQ